MRALLTGIAAVVAVLAIEHAWAQETSNLVTGVTLSQTIKSSYVTTGGLVASPYPSLQTGVSAALKGGFYAGVWNAIDPFAGINRGFGTETDLTIGNAGEIGDTGFGYDLGVEYFDLWPTVGHFGKEDMLHVYGEADVPKLEFGAHTFVPYLYVESYHSLDGGRLADFDRIFVSPGIKHSWAFGSGWTFSQKASWLHSPQALGLKSLETIRWEGGIDWDINDHVTLNVIRGYTWLPVDPRDDHRSGYKEPRAPQGVVATGITIHF